MASNVMLTRSPTLINRSSSRRPGLGSDLCGQGQQFIGGVSHCGNNNHNILSGTACLHNAFRHRTDMRHIRDRRTTIFLHHTRSGHSPPPARCGNPRTWEFPSKPSESNQNGTVQPSPHAIDHHPFDGPGVIPLRFASMHRTSMEVHCTHWTGGSNRPLVDTRGGGGVLLGANNQYTEIELAPSRTSFGPAAEWSPKPVAPPAHSLESTVHGL